MKKEMLTIEIIGKTAKGVLNNGRQIEGTIYDLSLLHNDVLIETSEDMYVVKANTVQLIKKEKALTLAQAKKLAESYVQQAEEEEVGIIELLSSEEITQIKKALVGHYDLSSSDMEYLTNSHYGQFSYCKNDMEDVKFNLFLDSIEYGKPFIGLKREYIKDIKANLSSY